MKYLLLFSAFAVLTTGCRKNLDDVDDVHFDVSLEAETFKVGEPVRFHFSGNPDFIIFYSGEKGNDYAYKRYRPDHGQRDDFLLLHDDHRRNGRKPQSLACPGLLFHRLLGRIHRRGRAGRHVDRHHRPFHDADRHRDNRSAVGRRECHRILLRPGNPALFQFPLGSRTLRRRDKERPHAMEHPGDEVQRHSRRVGLHAL